MFRHKIGARILVERNEGGEIIEVEILAKAPNAIKARVLSSGWFDVGKIYWLFAHKWSSRGRVKTGD